MIFCPNPVLWCNCAWEAWHPQGGLLELGMGGIGDERAEKAPRQGRTQFLRSTQSECSPETRLGGWPFPAASRKMHIPFCHIHTLGSVHFTSMIFASNCAEIIAWLLKYFGWTEANVNSGSGKRHSQRVCHEFHNASKPCNISGLKEESK